MTSSLCATTNENEKYVRRRHFRGKEVSEIDSILNTVWEEPHRPYSQRELEDMQEWLFSKCQLSNMYIFHEKCGHVYHVKQNGVKYKQLIFAEPTHSQNDNCSVCWKLRKTPQSLLNTAIDLLHLFREEFHNETNSYYKQELYRIIYTWLYLEHFENET